MVCDHLDRFVAGEIRRLMLFMPPRHGKSELVSRRLPAFIFGRDPDARVVATSYSADLASLMNRDVQRIVDSPEYARLFPDTRLFGRNVRTIADGSYLRNNDIFEIVGRDGYYRSAGVGGGITGMGFKYGIIDDPFKNRKEANSPTVRKAVWEWYTSTFYTRQAPGAGILLTVTRWHADDLAGRLLRAMVVSDDDPDREFADTWTVLVFPAEATGEAHAYDPREAGEALWEARYPTPVLKRFHKAVGDYDYAALYQQDPMPDGGGLFKRDKFRLIDGEPAGLRSRVRFWDLAASERTSADYTAGCLHGETPEGDEVVLDVRRFQSDWDALGDRIEAQALQDGPGVLIGIEQAFMQSRIVKDLLLRPALRGYSIRGYQPDTDKFTRALPFAARVGADLVYVLNRAWTEDYLRELCAFPLGAHDDQVDGSSGAHFMLDEARSRPRISVGTKRAL